MSYNFHKEIWFSEIEALITALSSESPAVRVGAFDTLRARSDWPIIQRFLVPSILKQKRAHERRIN